MMPELHELSVAEAAAQIRDGTLSPVALAEALLERIDALDGDLRAWVTIDRDAVLSASREREAEVRRGDPLGLIHGVPVGLKDIFYTEGMLTACGSKVYADFVPAFDATSVAKIKAAGGIILGKAVTTEFASSDPSPTRKPVEPGAHARRLQQRIVCGGGGADGSGRSRLADGRVHLPPGGLQWHRRREAHLRAYLPVRGGPVELVAGPCGHPDPHCGRRRADADRAERSGRQ